MNSHITKVMPATKIINSRVIRKRGILEGVGGVLMNEPARASRRWPSWRKRNMMSQRVLLQPRNSTVMDGESGPRSFSPVLREPRAIFKTDGL